MKGDFAGASLVSFQVGEDSLESATQKKTVLVVRDTFALEARVESIFWIQALFRILIASEVLTLCNEINNI